MTTKEMIAVMQAYEEGKKIQCRDSWKEGLCWHDICEPSWNWYNYDYRIKPEEEKPQRMTNRQFAEWCGKGNGQFKRKGGGFIFFYCSYTENEENGPVSQEILIRPWGSDDWVEPTVDIYERDCKGRVKNE